MQILYPLGLTIREATILVTIFIYRGLRAKDVAAFIHNTKNYSLSDEKSVYNYLKKLKRKGLIKSQRLQYVQSLGSIYYLTNDGLEVVKEILNIPIGQEGNGLLPLSDKTTFWDIPGEYQQPPMKQTGHFLLTIDFFKELVVDRELPFIHQTNFYSNLIYYVNQKPEQKLRPDAMVYVMDKLYAVEIDRATESHAQLVQKFRRYKEYYDYYQRVEDKSKVKKVDNILFVVEARSRRHGIQRRWTNVLSAFFNAFGNEFPEINLIMVPLDEVAQTLQFEANRSEVEKNVLNDLLTQLDEEGFYSYGNIGSYYLAINQESKSCKLVINHVHLEFESRLYKDKFELHHIASNGKRIIAKTEELSDFEYLGGHGIWISPFNPPCFADGIDKTQLDEKFISKLLVSMDDFKRYELNKDFIKGGIN